MNKQLIVGFCGAAGSGKTTAAEMLLREFGLRATRVPFASPIKEMLYTLGVPQEHLYGSPAQKAQPLGMLNGKSARFAMQTLGTEWGRDCMGSRFWLELWRERVRRVGFVEIIIVDDVRFPNEVEEIQRLDGIVLRIMRGDTPAAAHASEDWRNLEADADIENAGSQRALRDAVLSCVNFHRFAAEGAPF